MFTQTSSAHHLFIEQRHSFTDSFWTNIIERSVNVTNSLLNSSVITNTVQLLVFFLEAFIIIKTFGKFFCYADDVPIVGYFLRPQFVDTDGTTTKLVNTYTGCD